MLPSGVIIINHQRRLPCDHTILGPSRAVKPALPQPGANQCMPGEALTLLLHEGVKGDLHRPGQSKKSKCMVLGV